MRRYSLVPVVAVVAICVLITSCAGSIGFRKATAVNKISAEVAYDAIYTGYLHGLVSRETKNEAARWYDAYVIAQTAAVTAINAEDYQTAADKIALAQLVMGDLVDMAIDLGLIEIAPAEEVL